MGKYIMVVPSSALPGKDDKFNEWYDNCHVRELCEIPGISSGARWDALTDVSPHQPPANYLAIYELDTDDPKAVIAEMFRRGGSGEMSLSEDIDPDSAKVWIYKKH